jgi:hypothetical protein
VVLVLSRHEISSEAGYCSRKESGSGWVLLSAPRRALVGDDEMRGAARKEVFASMLAWRSRRAFRIATTI